MRLSFLKRQTVEFKKDKTAGLAQSNATKYNSQYTLANQRKVSVTTRQKLLVGDGGSSAKTLALTGCETIVCLIAESLRKSFEVILE